MKKLLLITLVLLCGALFSTVSAGNPQNIPMQTINEDGVNEGNTKTPPLRNVV